MLHSNHILFSIAPSFVSTLCVPITCTIIILLIEVKGRTPLDVARKNYNGEIVKMLATTGILKIMHNDGITIEC